MQKLIEWSKKNTGNVSEQSIPPLNGLRALLVFVVSFFHLWQQSWLTPRFSLGLIHINMDYILRSGYIWVDGMLLLSGFLLYLPYAAAKRYDALPKTLDFYKRRAARILPSYYLCIFIMLFFIALPENQHKNIAALRSDLFSHLTFTFNFSLTTYYNTKLNGVLWTLAVEMQFYLIFPLLARGFKRSPLFTYAAMCLTAFAFRSYAASLKDPTPLFNQMPAFLDVYANGFVAASCFISLKRKLNEDKWTKLFMTALAFISFILLLDIAYKQALSPSIYYIQIGQMAIRYKLSLVLSMFMLGLCFANAPLQLIFSNRLMTFLGAISFQYYIWHQVIALRLKKWGIPGSKFSNPHQIGDTKWQIAYVALVLLLSVALAALLTYFFEQPLNKAIRNGRRKK